jgi:hypothetical protein
MALLVVVFRHYDPAGRTSALGLPDGSVQAVIALALILIFALYGVYLHGRAGSPELRQSACLTRGQVSVIPNGTVVRVKAERWLRGSACTKDPPTATVTRPPPNATARQRRRARQATRRAAARAARNTVTRYRATVAVPNTERSSITTQLLSTIGALVVAVSGFYFGSKAVQAGVKRGGESAQGGAALALTVPGMGPEGGGDGARKVEERPRGPDGEGDEEDEAAYGEASPVTQGPSPAEVREELHSPPLAEEDDAEESLLEQGVEETTVDEVDDAAAEEPEEGQEPDEAQEPGPEAPPPEHVDDEEPPEKV